MPAVTQAIHSDPEILGGTPVFIGTRVPLRNLIDYWKADTAWTSSWTPFLPSRATTRLPRLKLHMRS